MLEFWLKFDSVPKKDYNICLSFWQLTLGACIEHSFNKQEYWFGIHKHSFVHTCTQKSNENGRTRINETEMQRDIERACERERERPHTCAHWRMRFRMDCGSTKCLSINVQYLVVDPTKCRIQKARFHYTSLSSSNQFKSFAIRRSSVEIQTSIFFFH